MSWKAEVRVPNDAKWYDNAVRFKSRDEALKYGRDLFNRWTTAEHWRVVETDDEVTARWLDGKIAWKDVNYAQTTTDDHEL
jgi:hypothetical protein